MAEASDLALPGKAGLFFSCEELNEAGWLVEHEARRSLERWCSYCGQSACYGYGVSLTADGTWTCADASCRASAEDEEAQRLCPSPSAELLSPASDAPDLFSMVPDLCRADASERGGRV